MERNLKLSILHTISGLIGVAAAAIYGCLFLIGITIPTVTEDFTNKLLFYAGVIIFISYHSMIATVNYSYTAFTKAKMHWKHRRIDDED